jgi:uncharacterized protein YdbL (DUF1318 family)
MKNRTWIRAGALLLLAFTMSGCVSRPPSIAHVHLGHALTGVHVTPDKKGYLLVAEKQAEDVVALAAKAARSTELAQVKTDVAAAVTATNSEDAFGLKHSLIMASNHISFAATSSDASRNVQESAPLFARDTVRVVERCELIALLGKDVAQARSVDEARLLAAEIAVLARANLDGEDANQDGKVGATAAEYGMKQLRAELDGIIARENPAYRTVEQWYLFNLVKLPNGRWVFDKLGRGGNIDGYQ